MQVFVLCRSIEILILCFCPASFLLLYSPKKVGYSIHIEFIWTQFNSICKRCPCLELPICRICSENDLNLMKLIRGFLAYFTMVRLMERMLLRLGDLLVTSGSGPFDLEDLRTSGSLRRIGRIVTLSSFPNLLLGSDDFFFALSALEGD